MLNRRFALSVALALPLVASVASRAAEAPAPLYAEKNGVYRRAWPGYVSLLRDDWKPWLDGRGSLKGAVDSMVSGQPVSAMPAA
jgi:hypothetical protein